MMPSSRRPQPEAGPCRCIPPANNSPHFFKIVCSSTIEKQKLKIPLKFVSKHGENLSNTMFLKVPVGSEAWRVESKKNENGEVWIDRGWQDFADFHSIKFGNVVVFKLESNSLFHVLIFDRTATEIEYPFKNANIDELKVPKMEESEDDDDDDDDVSVEILDDFPSSQTRKEKRAKTEIGAAESEKLRAFALERAKAFKSEQPFFIAIMQPSYVSTNFNLNIPFTFVKKYFTQKHYNVLLRVTGDERTWVANYSRRLRKSELRGEWKAFVQDNRLRIGDVCVFELIEGVENSVKVVIFRAN